MSGPLLQDNLARSVENSPDAVAVVLEDEQLTYGELAALSHGLAVVLREQGVAPGDRVGLLLPKTPAALVAMHAVLQVGGVYVPLDPDSPAPRLARIVQAAEPRVVLAAPSTAQLVAGLDEVVDLPVVGSVENDPVVGGDGAVHSTFTREDWATAARPSTDGGLVRVDDDAPAHLLFTSGSTGEPKGVVITHRMVAAFLDWARATFQPRPTDRISGHPPLHFDLSTFDIYGTLGAGAQLHLVPAKLGMNPRGLAAFIRDRELTQWFSVPSVLTFMSRFDAVGQDDFPALQRLLWCGEVLPTPVLAHWMRHLPHVTFSNLYGPTEATIASSWYTVPEAPEDETAPVPIGTACTGEELLVLDEYLEPVPAGEIGDLYIAGAGLSPGYWRDRAKTEAAFVPDPRAPAEGEGTGGRIYRTGDLARMDDAGTVHFVGRADSQIKSRGYRIELGEVESALHAVAGVRDAAVVGVDLEDFGGTAICAAYVGKDGLEPAHLRTELAGVLPGYMLPARWLPLDVLPKNVNGKIDRPALRQEFNTQHTARGGPAR